MHRWRCLLRARWCQSGYLNLLSHLPELLPGVLFSLVGDVGIVQRAMSVERLVYLFSITRLGYEWGRIINCMMERETYAL
jgi:hypothetical protein